MTITLSLSDILLIIITLAVAGVSVYMVIALQRLGTVLGELQKTLVKVGEVLPRVEKTVMQAEQTLVSIDTLATGASKAVDDVTVVTAIARTVVEEGAEQVSGALASLAQIGTILGAIRSGWQCFMKKDTEETGEEEAEAPQED